MQRVLIISNFTYSGNTIAKIRYIKIGDPTPINAQTTNNTLMMVESHPKYSAKPPQTPASILSFIDFFIFFGIRL